MQMRTTLSLVAAFAAAPAALAAQIAVRATPRTESFSYVVRGDESPRAVVGITTSAGDASDTLGLRVTDVAAGGPADKAGIREGDRIQSINGIDLRIETIDIGDQSMAEAMSRRLTRELGKLTPGDDVALRVYHDGQVRSLTVKTVPSDSLYGNPMGLMSARASNRAMLGVSLAVSGSKRDTLGIQIIGVTDQGPADKAGLEEGDRLAAINGVNLKVDRADAGDSWVANARYQRLQKEMARVKPGDDVTLEVWAGGRFKTVHVKAAKASDVGEGQNTFMIRGDGGSGEPMMRLDVNGPLIREKVQQAMEQARQSVERAREDMQRVRVEMPAPHVRWMDEEMVPPPAPPSPDAMVAPAMAPMPSMAPMPPAPPAPARAMLLPRVVRF
ncbi:MAG: PDZ domain-containing protein [Gemmatimonadota bacterium]|nr:PDZ domain-containing protein [Gemmatimonadota bacterium]